MTKKSLEALWEPKLNELQRDYVSLWELQRYVRRVEPAMDEETLRETILAMIERALKLGEAEAGTWPRGKDGLETVWREPVEEIIDRIRNEWIALGHDPKPGEVVWLQSPRARDSLS